MREQIRNLSRRESIFIVCRDRMRAGRRFRAGLLKWCLGIFMAIVLALAAILITPTGATLASIRSTSPMLSAQYATPSANTTKGANACKAGTRAAGPSSFTSVEADYYWSSTTLEGQDRAYFGDIDHGHLLNGAFTTSLRVWPVRGGQR